MDRRAITSEVAAYPRGRVPRALRRRQVLAEAHVLFVERGYAGASMDELARRVGVSKPVIYDIAGSKEALFREVMAAVAEELAATVVSAVAAETDERRLVRAGILAFLVFVRERREAWAALLSSDSGPAGAELAALRSQQATLIARMVAARAEAPDPRTAQVLAHAINGASEFVALWWQDHPEVEAEALADLLTAAFSPDLLALVGRSLG